MTFSSSVTNIPIYYFSVFSLSLSLSLPFLNASDWLVQIFALVLRGSWHTNAGDCCDDVSSDLGLIRKTSLHIILHAPNQSRNSQLWYHRDQSGWNVAPDDVLVFPRLCYLSLESPCIWEKAWVYKYQRLQQWFSYCPPMWPSVNEHLREAYPTKQPSTRMRLRYRPCWWLNIIIVHSSLLWVRGGDYECLRAAPFTKSDISPVMSSGSGLEVWECTVIFPLFEVPSTPWFHKGIL